VPEIASRDGRQCFVKSVVWFAAKCELRVNNFVAPQSESLFIISAISSALAMTCLQKSMRWSLRVLLSSSTSTSTSGLSAGSKSFLHSCTRSSYNAVGFPERQSLHRSRADQIRRSSSALGGELSTYQFQMSHKAVVPKFSPT